MTAGGSNAVSAALVLAAMALGPSVQAHHSVLSFDGATPATVTGTVTRVLWQNPHTYIYLDVERDGGVEKWAVESDPPEVLRRRGWRKSAIAPGDTITSTGARARDGRPLMRCAFIVLDGGARLPCFAEGGN